MKHSLAFASLAVFGLALGACTAENPSAPATETASPSDPAATSSAVSAPAALARSNLSPQLQRLVAQVDEFNAKLAAAGSDLRLQYPWLFVVGGGNENGHGMDGNEGTDPFGQLRTGARWIQSDVSYIIDSSDFTPDETPANVEAALIAAFETWDDVPRANLTSTEAPDPGGNFDVLDGTIVGGQCLSIFDFTSPNLDLSTGNVTPEADVVFGGWLPPEYFVECLGNANILGVTWFFSGGDANADGFADQQYVEQYYNDGFNWATSGSVFLDGASPIDIQSVIVHEVGHTHGLGHFGGPINRQPFSLKPNGRVFNPEAVMNPFYLNGEKRDLLPTDLAAFSTLYSRR